MFCRKCGRQMEEGELYCRGCGTKMEARLWWGQKLMEA